MTSTSVVDPPVFQSNTVVAAHLDEIAGLLEAQDANAFRVRAYRRGAESVRALDRPVVEILQQEGLAGLDALPHVGPGIAHVIREFLTTGRHGMLDRLRGASDPVATLETVPGIGRTLAHRLHDEADIDTLEQLEAAAHDGRLGRIPGFGARRVEGIRNALAMRLGKPRPVVAPPGPDQPPVEPTVAELLDVDREYREASRGDRLPRIAPRRFNPAALAWLPVLHTTRGERHYTALFSNTALAHKLQRTHDWVVLYFDGATGEHQHTVVTATTGALKGRRVVRGRETECEAFYATDRHA